MPKQYGQAVNNGAGFVEGACLFLYMFFQAGPLPEVPGMKRRCGFREAYMDHGAVQAAFLQKGPLLQKAGILIFRGMLFRYAAPDLQERCSGQA